MLISELAARTNVPVPTIKFYLREGILMPGRTVSATRAHYDEWHARRIALIRALSARGLSIAQTKSIVGLIDDPQGSLFATLGAATAALTPPGDAAGDDDCPRARAALAAVDCVVPDDLPAVAQLERALADAEAAGLPMTEDRLRAYAPHVRAIAAYDIEQIPVEPAPAAFEAAIEYAVLGTLLYEPILAALRRVAHAEQAGRRLADR
ncbi:MerR family transcriptional regulator [Mycobacterium conspicuum]|uniref:Transcriptional regulator n=1 Tax=Mycobacterium conspicuum TaxID=44010 RepID=A0A1X1T885_9MYCO|nr:MerR family transcriptional regulator [Mycobacterium conspicuum]ORV40776.1 MerR family transcriptional regulator [Mycobacterium conspicuum]BBZ38973.1 transcriptional regulator [Mycobacterium conspicuum]